MHVTVRRSLATLCAIIAGAICSMSVAQNYPSKPLRIVVPFAAGGPVDTIARALAAPLSAQLGQTVIVDNKAGAATIIGTDHIVKSAPDGYSMLVVGAGSRTILPAITSLPYDPAKDLLPVTRVASSPQIFVISNRFAALGIHTLKDVVIWAKANKGKLNIGSVGAGTITSLVAELLKREAGFEAVEVPFKGGAPAVTALLSGEIDFLSADVSAVIPHIQAKKMVGVAITGPHRVADIPEVATVLEAGYPNLIAVNVYCLYLPANTPRDVVLKLNQSVRAVLSTPELKAQYAKSGMTAEGSSPEELERFLHAESNRWLPLAKSLGVRIN